ncbi:hypothetical protein [Arabiibacter massiliensis]|uniref:hypothetical protein n=1 Tax=Arabiibacter massiliensis TaxID=1870985 RepID=UPI0009B9663B|nr:hypothetical protein [Arabiibacter massiliensis]
MTDLSNDRLSTLLGISIVPAVLEAAGIDGPEGIEEFYRSKLYGLLSDPQTAMWHLSPQTLATLYVEERSTGTFDVPEEQS